MALPTTRSWRLDAIAGAGRLEDSRSAFAPLAVLVRLYSATRATTALLNVHADAVVLNPYGNGREGGDSMREELSI